MLDAELSTGGWLIADAALSAGGAAVGGLPYGACVLAGVGAVGSVGGALVGVRTLSTGGRLVLVFALSAGGWLVSVFVLSASTGGGLGATFNAAVGVAVGSAAGTASDALRCVREFGFVDSGELLVPV
ncbi:MAG TPA: hypothetical protein VGO46_12300 [Gemmatimonadaceae bacterium]|nr:hypothetical protein [Gemmatimonadaceae bacterium]